LRRNSDAAPLSVGHLCVIERASYFGTGAVVFGCAPALRCCIGRVWSKHCVGSGGMRGVRGE